MRKPIQNWNGVPVCYISIVRLVALVVIQDPFVVGLVQTTSKGSDFTDLGTKKSRPTEPLVRHSKEETVMIGKLLSRSAWPTRFGEL
jgi:hypothetical protein